MGNKKRRLGALGKVFATMLLIVATFLVAGCEKDNDNDVKSVPISCTVDLQGTDRNGLSVMTMGSGYSLSSDSSQLMVQVSDMPQLFIVADEDYNVRMLYRGVVSEGQSIVINKHTTALAMVTCNPYVAMVGDSDFTSMTTVIEQLQSFQTFEALVGTQIDMGNNLFDTNNSQLMRSIESVFDELLGTEPDSVMGSKDGDPMPWADYRPLRFEWIDPSKGKFYLSNYSLVPTYYGTITTESGDEKRLVLPTISSYSLVGAAWNLLWRNPDAFHGERVEVSLTEDENNTIELTNLYDARAVVDIGAHMLGDLLNIISFKLPDDWSHEIATTAGSIIANAVAAGVQADNDNRMRACAESIAEESLSYIKGKLKEYISTAGVTLVADVTKKAWAKKVLEIGVDKILTWYNATEGSANLAMRIYYLIRYPNDISFCAWYGQETGEKSNMQVTECKMDDWVDLGLPSGLLWATRNVGATSPEDYGDYFAWGETSPKSIYDWSTYRYCNWVNAYVNADGQNLLTKYCSLSGYGYNGFTDNLTTLQPGDDAASANYGGRTPTKEEWQELMDHTTSQWTTQNGVNGHRFTGPNGNSLFLPAAGVRGDSSLYFDGSSGDYWSSSLSTDYPARAWRFYNQNMYYDGSRYYGRSVRAVRQN